MMTPKQQSDPLDALAERWPSSIVAASQVRAFTGGLITGKTLANLRSAGEPVPDSLLIGGRHAYIVDSLIRWLRSRLQSGGHR